MFVWLAIASDGYWRTLDLAGSRPGTDGVRNVLGYFVRRRNAAVGMVAKAAAARLFQRREPACIKGLHLISNLTI